MFVAFCDSVLSEGEKYFPKLPALMGSTEAPWRFLRHWFKQVPLWEPSDSVESTSEHLSGVFLKMPVRKHC